MAEKGIGYSGTFLMCFIAAQMATCWDSINLSRTRSTVNNIERIVSAQQPQLHTENVLGGPEPESFYVIDGKRLYVTIDGEAVESYFPLQAEKGIR